MLHSKLQNLSKSTLPPPFRRHQIRSHTLLSSLLALELDCLVYSFSETTLDVKARTSRGLYEKLALAKAATLKWNAKDLTTSC